MKNTNLKVAHKKEGEILTPEEKVLYETLNKLPKPDVQFKLSSSQKYWWYFFGMEFIKTKQVSKLDLMHLQRAAFWMDSRCKAYYKIRKLGYKGLVQTFPSGANNVTGHVSIVEKSDKALDEVSAHFGLSIRDRQKLKIEQAPENQLNLFETVMQKLSNS